MNFTSSDRPLLTEDERIEHRRDTQKRYVQNKKEELISYRNEATTLRVQNQILATQLNETQNAVKQLQSQLNEKNSTVTLLQQLNNEKDVSRASLQSQIREQENTINQLRQQLNERNPSSSELQLQQQVYEKEIKISQLQIEVNQQQSYLSRVQEQNNEKEQKISQLESQVSNFQSSLYQVQQQNSEKDQTISQLQRNVSDSNQTVSQLQQQNSEKDQTITELQNQTSQFESFISQLQLQNSQKDSTITQLQSQLSNCVTTDVDRRLQEMSQTLENKNQQEQLCLQTINQLNSENSNLKVFRDIISELNSKYPKFLPSFVYEIQQPGNESAYQEIDNWSREQLNRISSNEIIPLTSFRNLSPSPVNSFPIQTQQIYSNPNIPNVSLETNTIIPNVNPIVNDPNFPRWLSLYNNNMKTSSEYKNLYQNLRNRYGESPVKILKQYT